MGNTQTREPGHAGPAPAPAPALPDVNAETYPFDFVQYLLDQTANFNLFSVPERHRPEELLLTPDSQDWFSINGGYGIAIRSELRRFGSFVHRPAADELNVTQAVGEEVGTLRARWLFCTEGSEWEPGRLPPPTIYDPWSPQRFTMLDGEFKFGTADGFRGYGVGRTYPVSAGGRPQLLAAAVGNLTDGEGRFHGLEGTFVMTGTITPDLGFLGQISLRVVDPGGALRTDREIADLTSIEDPDPSSTFFVMRGDKKDRTVRTTFGPPAAGGIVSLVTPSQFRAAHFNVARGAGGLRTETSVGPVVSKMDATVYFNLMAPPAKVVEGISFDLKFPAAPGQKGVRFAGFGPITGGTGPLEGAQGILTVNSLIGIAPHALTLMHVLHLVDPDGRFRAGGARRRPTTSRPARRETQEQASAPAVHAPEAKPEGPREDEKRVQLAEDDPFAPMLKNAENYTEMYLKWRRGFRKCAGELSAIFARQFNSHLHVGEFPGLEIDPQALKASFEAERRTFDRKTFDRYAGKAAGTFRTYELGTNRELDKTVLYSYWRPETFWVNGRHAKKISGSFAGYFDPHALPPLSEGKVDIIFNSFRDDVGLTSWVEVYQNQRQQRTSFSYKLPHNYEILWLVKDVSLGGQPVDNNVFMASHEWKGELNGKMCYFMVAFFYDIDFESCTARLYGDRYWRALYVEE
jgi:hypothetical protein